MILKITFALVSFFFSAVLAEYSNETYVPTTLTLSPTFSVEPQLSIYSYTDETTTFYITSTMYATYWFTPVTTSSIPVVEISVTDVPTTYEKSGSIYTSTITSTITSTLKLTQTTSKTIDAEVKAVGASISSNFNSCAPITKYVTITAQPITEYVTVTAGASSVQWNNGTITA